MFRSIVLYHPQRKKNKPPRRHYIAIEVIRENIKLYFVIKHEFWYNNFIGNKN